MQLHVSAPFRFSSIGLRHFQRKIRYRLAIALPGKSASARIKFADFLQESPGYKGPVLKLNNRILVACGDHYLWTRNGDSGVGQGLLKHGAWQRDDFETALHLIKNYGHKTGGVFVDVGANIGTQSIYAALEHNPD